MYFHKQQWLKVGLLSICCATLPDVDSISFRLGIPYEHWLGHRGFFHSIIFAAIIAVFASRLSPGKNMQEKNVAFGIFFAGGLLHDVSDAMTNGGLGVAFFSPFINTRYFFPWHPIEVSPISLNRFFSSRGCSVLKSEFVWVIVPSLCLMAFTSLYRYNRRVSRRSHDQQVQ